MMRIIWSIIGIISMIFVVAIVGQQLFKQFPELEPLWTEFKVWVSTIYRNLQAEYGTMVVIIFVIGVGIMFATSAKKGA